MVLFLDICIGLWLIKIAYVDIKKMFVTNDSLVVLISLIVVQKIFVDVVFMDILGAIIASSIVFGGLFLAGKGFIGGGDVKLIVVLSVWLGLFPVIVAIYLAFILGGIVGALCLLFKWKSRKDRLPFAPFLAVGAIIAHFDFIEIEIYKICII